MTAGVQANRRSLEGGQTCRIMRLGRRMVTRQTGERDSEGERKLET